MAENRKVFLIVEHFAMVSRDKKYDRKKGAGK